MKSIDAIKNLGLNETESRIYLLLISNGGQKASVIAKELEIKRTTIYQILKSMTSAGFINVFFRNNERLYYAEKPTKVASLMQQKLDIFEQLIPTLPTTEKQTAAQVGLQYIESLPELKLFYTKILNEYKNKSYCIIGSAADWEGLDPDWFIQFRKDRATNKIRTKLLLTQESKKINPLEKPLLRTFKYLPANYTFKSTIDIFNDKILIVSPKISSLAVVVNIPLMTDVFQSVFDIIWELLTEKK